MLVYGIFLIIVGVTAMAQTVMVSTHFSTTTLNSVVGTDAALVRLFVTSTVSPDDLDASGPSAERQAALEERLASLIEPGQIVRVEIRLPDGRVVAADRPELRGAVGASTPDFTIALGGDSATAGIDDAAASEAVGPPLAVRSVLREYFPLSTDGRVRAVVGVWRDAGPILADVDAIRLNIALVTLSAGIVAGIVLFLVFRSAQGRISSQTAALVAAISRDTLTGTLNHGALVDVVARAVDESRAGRGGFGVALVDIDNFRLLNENYGHEAGDEALIAVVDLLRRELPAFAAFGRYGPDELLFVVPSGSVQVVGDVLERLRAALVDYSLQFDASERLPLTVSAGVCTFPEHADSVTELLTVAALTLREAKASGGDAIRFGGLQPAAEAGSRTFDVFQGLILAVDTKDRYTKRHSEDVARYAVFLAQQLGLDPELIQTIRVAGLLHDVGKIGIPDYVLRKPGRLTPEEMAIVQQHVALGDLIVRDLPDLEVVRAGVRNHHERWDGKGYLDRLAGEDIPLVARILSVGDTFSAMTTTRPYRKAKSVQEALTELADVAGTQLDEKLVGVFIRGIESVPDAPLPGADVQPLGLWTPYRQVA
jgi:diguanylate cyclase (GGDEF)-like protein/putative nucleotidyltransferase with HDIG domain